MWRGQENFRGKANLQRQNLQKLRAGYWWLTPVILATLRAGGSEFKANPGK
jgi:hypothetical protein